MRDFMICHENIIIKIPVDLWTFEVIMRVQKIKKCDYDRRSCKKKLSIIVGNCRFFYENFILCFLLYLGRRFSLNFIIYR
jgi:hypothetical protein